MSCLDLFLNPESISLLLSQPPELISCLEFFSTSKSMSSLLSQPPSWCLVFICSQPPSQCCLYFLNHLVDFLSTPQVDVFVFIFSIPELICSRPLSWRCLYFLNPRFDLFSTPESMLSLFSQPLVDTLSFIFNPPSLYVLNPRVEVFIIYLQPRVNVFPLFLTPKSTLIIFILYYVFTLELISILYPTTVICFLNFTIFHRFVSTVSPTGATPLHQTSQQPSSTITISYHQSVMKPLSPHPRHHLTQLHLLFPPPK